MKNYLKKFDKNSLLLAFIVTIIIPYFQKLNFSSSADRTVLGFPFKYLTVGNKLNGKSLFYSFDIDAGSLILSTISFYLVIKLFKYFFCKNKN